MSTRVRPDLRNSSLSGDEYALTLCSNRASSVVENRSRCAMTYV